MPVVVKVTFFVTREDAADVGSERVGKRRTQVWLSVALTDALSPRDVLVAAFRHASDRLGGATMDDAPSHMLMFLQSHGEFLQLDVASKPLVEYSAVSELVHHEGRDSILLALVSEAEFHRLNSPSATFSERGEGVSTPPALPMPSPSMQPAPGDGASGQQQASFKNRSRQGSILPKALGKDPLADKRIRAPHTSFATDDHDDDPLLPTASPSPFDDSDGVANDSFMSSGGAAAAAAGVSSTGDGRRFGSVVVDYFTPLGVQLSTSVEYPIGAVCEEVVDTAVRQLISGVERKLSEAGVPLSEADAALGFLRTVPAEDLVLLYHSPSAISVRTFARHDVLPVSRGLRPEGVHLFLSAKNRGSLASQSHTLAASPVLRVVSMVGLVKDLERMTDATGTAWVSVGAKDRTMYPATMERIQGLKGSLRFPASTLNASSSSSATPVDEETMIRLRVAVAHEQLLAARAQLKSQSAMRSAVQSEVDALEVRKRELEEIAAEARGAARDTERLEALVQWFEQSVEDAMERQRAMTKQLFELQNQPNPMTTATAMAMA